VDGLFSIPPSPVLEYQCPPPNLSHVTFTQITTATDIHPVAEEYGFTNATSPEDAMRKASSDLSGDVNMMLEYVRNVIEEDGPFQGIIGASEGAMAAATFLIDHLKICRKLGSPSMLKRGF
jgi:hypothetical protein